MIKYLLLLGPIFFLYSCSGVKPISTKNENKVGSYCNIKYKNTEKKHLVMAAKIKSSVLANCFKNYLRFETNKKQYFSVCNQLSIKKNGRVGFVQITDARRKNLPKDFKMCIEQEYWTMNFSGLQLQKNHLIKFQLNFSSL